MKEKIMAETRSHLLKGDDIKLGPGGIREIEFIIQALQMVFGGNIPSLQEKNTLKSLTKLKEIPNPSRKGIPGSFSGLPVFTVSGKSVTDGESATNPFPSP